MAKVLTMGSSALQYDYYSSTAPKRKPTPQWEEQQRRAHLREQRERQRRLAMEQAKQAQLIREHNRKLAWHKLALTLLTVTAFSLLSVIVVRYAQIAALQWTWYKMQITIVATEQDVDQINYQLVVATNLQTVAQKASEELGMGYPKGYQVLSVETQTPATSGATADNTHTSGQ